MTHRLTQDDVLARVKTLPALPQVVFELQAALQDDNCSTERIVRLVASDQGLTASALKLANSSFYGVRGRVVSLRDAVQILGVQTLSAAVLTAAVMSRFTPSACAGFNIDSCWRHALATATCTQLLAETRGVDPCAGYTVGLLHDIGTLALATYFPQPFAASLAWSREHDVVPMEAEQQVLGLDHASVGAMVAAQWRFAPDVVEAIRHHHGVTHEAAPGAAGGLLDALHLADNISHALDLAHQEDDMVPPLSLGVWERFACTGTELHRVFERIEARLENVDLGLFR